MVKPAQRVFNQDEWNPHSPMKKLTENLFELQTLETSEARGTVANKRIAELRTLIPAQIIGHYDRFMARGKKGVAVIKGQVCTACHMQVPRNTVLTLMHGDDIQICENCGRYLCLPEHVNPSVPDEKAKPSRKKQKALAEAA
jgi:predicted  nucleic acid-binding Zn-ribbon protein